MAARTTSQQEEDRECLWLQYARTRDPDVRERVIAQHQRLVYSLARRFWETGEPLEDLVQVGNIGLINALDRYDPELGVCFSTYATPTILGEIKRYLRDKAPGIKIPRPLQERYQAARQASLRMTADLGRPPTIAEIAVSLGATEEQILEAMESGEAAALWSLDALQGDPSRDISLPLHDIVGEPDAALVDFETYADLRRAVASLGACEREIILLRFFEEMSQAKIARRLNLSQMQVSRLQRRTLKLLRERLLDACRIARRAREHPASTGASGSSPRQTG